MNNPENHPVDIEEERRWLKDHKATTGLSWSDLGKRMSIAQGTISQFGGTGYAGDELKLAQAVARYRQSLAIQAQIAIEAPVVPGFIETPTSKQFLGAYGWAQRGKMVAIAAGPGTAKTISAEHYRDSVANVWLVTLAPSTAGVNTMQIATLEAMGERDVKGTPQALTRRICDRLRNSDGLLIFDEAQHASVKSLEEIRGWWDKTKVGIVVQGNAGLLQKLEGGSRSTDYAQLFSRLSLKIVRPLPAPGDADAICEAWSIEDERQRNFIRSISQKPGGLRTVTNMIELACMTSRSMGRSLELADLQDAWAQLASRPVLS